MSSGKPPTAPPSPSQFSMTPLDGDLADRPIHDVLRAVNAGGGSGLLEIQVGDARRRLYFSDGDLYLPATHPLAQHLGELVAKLGDGGDKSVRERLDALVERMAGLVGDWRDGKFRFDADAASLPAERIGPLPTERLVMLVAVAGVDEAELVRRLGGERSKLSARSAPRPPDALGLRPEEHFVIEKLATPQTVAELVAAMPVDRRTTLRTLVALKTVGRLRASGRDSSGIRSLPPAEPAAPGAELAARLRDRFARMLREDPPTLPAEEYRQKITDLVGRSGAMTHYELLGVGPDTPVDAAQAPYEKLALLVHPENARIYRLEALTPMLEMLYERATQAYLTLSDAETRRRYNEQQEIELGVGKVTGERREAEQREAGKRNYEQALAHASRGEFHWAIELLELAVQADRRAEYLLALSRLQAKNPKWTSRAIETCRGALELDPSNADVRFHLGELYESSGEIERARAQYSAAVRERPHHVEAAARLRNLGTRQSSDPKSGLFDRLFGRKP